MLVLAALVSASAVHADERLIVLLCVGSMMVALAQLRFGRPAAAFAKV